MNFLIQPKKYKSLMADEGSCKIMDKTISFFENMGNKGCSTTSTRKSGIKSLLISLAKSKFLQSCLRQRNMQVKTLTVAGTQLETANTVNSLAFMDLDTGIVFR